MLLPRIDWEFRKTKEAFGFKRKSIKVLVFGNSTSMDGVNTEMIKSTYGSAYNFSVGGASLETNYLQLERYLKTNERPEKVLLFLNSLHSSYKNSNTINPIIDYYYKDLKIRWAIDELPIYKFRWLFVENLKKLFSRQHRSATIVLGQLRINRAIQDPTINLLQPIACKEAAFYQAEGYYYLGQMLKLCTDKGIKVYIFEMPCWNNLQNNCPDIMFKTDNGKEIDIVNLNTVDLCKKNIDPKNDWLSLNHLNFNGSKKITAVILDKVNQSDSLIMAK